MDFMDEINSIDDLTLKPTQSLASMKPKPKSGYVAMTVAVAMGRGGFRSRAKLEEKGNQGANSTYLCFSLLSSVILIIIDFLCVSNTQA
jgi:hypothetical protein